jgi:hypothetical protein
MDMSEVEDMNMSDECPSKRRLKLECMDTTSIYMVEVEGKNIMEERPSK